MNIPAGFVRRTMIVPITFRVLMIDIGDPDMVNSIELMEFEDVTDIREAAIAVEQHQDCYAEFGPTKTWQFSRNHDRAMWQHDDVLIVIYKD